jgi:hypothetical protein
MTEREIFLDGLGTPSGDYLTRFVKDKDGRKTLLYILSRMGYFSVHDTPEQAAVRNAAVLLLDDIRKKTGFSLDMDFIH